MARRALLLSLVLTFACAGTQHVEVQPDPERFEEGLVPGNSVELLRNGKVFDALEREISRAESSVHVILFIWRPGDPSDRITRALVERARAGVKCRVIIDPFWSVGFETEVKPQLEEAGCEVKIFKPLEDVRVPAELVERQHRKLVVIDGKVGITGGFGIWRSWLGNGVGEDNWRDVAVLFRGPVVGQAQNVFARDWRELTGQGLGEEAFPPLEFVGNSRAAFIGSEAAPDGELSAAQQIHYELISNAKERVWIQNSYFVPSVSLNRLLLERKRAGLDVQVIVPGDRHDMPIVLAAQRNTYKELTDGGIELFEYQAAMMHSKSMLIDDRFSVIGSINLDPMSLRQSRECALVVEDTALAAEMRADFERDLKLSNPVRSPPQKPTYALAWFVMWFLGSI